ncbi:MAG: hypothetical protein ABIO70_04965 [Pseudomonadota bacterium]
MKPWLLLLLAPLAVVYAQEAEAPRAERVNPHTDPMACASCHEHAPPEVGAAKPIVATCRSCHEDGDMHPVEVDVGETVIPASLPTEADGRMSCWTCHTDPVCPAGQPRSEPPYLRGGPYEQIRLQCFQCHERTTYERVNPHHPEMDREMGSDYCSACHTARPELGVKPEEARLREVVGGVCMTCHDPYPHQGTTIHMGALVDEEVAAKLPPEIALPADRSVQCWSCHEVHSRPPEADAHWLEDTRLSSALTDLVLQHMAEQDEVVWQPPYGADKPDHRPMLALPDQDGTLCRACHPLDRRP